MGDGNQSKTETIFSTKVENIISKDVKSKLNKLLESLLE